MPVLVGGFALLEAARALAARRKAGLVPGS